MKPTFLRRNTLFVAGAIMLGLSLVFSTFSVVRVLSAPLAALPSTVSVPNAVGFEGFLADSAGNPIAPDGAYTLTFSVYDAATGGSPLWSETQSQIQVTKGLYAVQLGAVNPLTTNLFNGNRWIGVTKGTDTEITPRTTVASVPFALNAANANTVNSLPVAESGTDQHVVASNSSGTVAVSGGLNVGSATGATAGQVKANDALSGYGSYPVGVYKIYDVTPSGQVQQDFDVSSLPAAFSNLTLRVSLRSNVAAASVACLIRINDITTATYDLESLYANGGAAAGGEQLNQHYWLAFSVVPGSTAPSGLFAIGTVEFFDFTNANKVPSCMIHTSLTKGVATGQMYQNSVACFGSMAVQRINKISVYLNSSNTFAAGSRMWLYAW